MLIQHFYYVYYIVAIPNPRLAYYLRAWHRFDREQSRLLLLLIILEFFTSELAVGFSLEFWWQKVSLSLQDSSHYLVDFNDAIVRMTSIRPLIFKSYIPCCYYHYYNFYYYYLIFREFFMSALTDGFSLEFQWQEVPSNLQDYSQYSGRY